MTVVHDPLRIGSLTVRNRLYRAPVLEGAGSGPDAAEAYVKAFAPNAKAGVGLVIQGSACIFEEGRTSPGMTLVNTRQRVLELRPVPDAVHLHGGSILLQAGHGGIYSMEAWHEPYASQRSGPILAVSPLPRLIRAAFIGVPIHVMTTDEVHAMVTRYGEVAAWAREAGYDGFQLASANAKLLDQFLSPFYNKRTDEFGGSLEKRAHVLRLIRASVAERAGADFPCLVKLPAEKAPPFTPRSTAEEVVRLAKLCEEWGYDAVTPVEVSVLPDTTLSRGGVPAQLWRNNAITTRFRAAAPSRFRRAVLTAGYVLGGKQHPFTPVWNRHLFREVKTHVGIPVFAVGGIRTADEVASILGNDEADMVGIGRPFYAEPDLPQRILGGSREPVLCRNSNHCVPPQMLGMKGVCYNPDVKKEKAARATTAGAGATPGTPG
ncbi:MAG: NADH:flavin oxidoreductase [Actinobacteria bacterium]|nr:NADH:flavin oxidoreductase [Actinomycetota bacterium]